MTPVRQNGFVESKGHTRQVSAECVAREGGFIGSETLRERRDWFDTFRGPSGQLGSWFAWCLGARGRVGVRLWRCMVGRREAWPKAGSTPLESLRSHRPPSRAGPIHQGESRPWRSGKHLRSSGCGPGCGRIRALPPSTRTCPAPTQGPGPGEGARRRRLSQPPGARMQKKFLQSAAKNPGSSPFRPPGRTAGVLRYAQDDNVLLLP